MDQKIRVGVVNYLNTRPLLFGIEQSQVIEEVTLIRDFPSNIAKMLLDSEIDLGLVPVAVIPRLKESHIITDYCIGCDGPVASVCLFSEVPIDQVEEVLLDYQSRTSVALARLLLADFWRIDPVFIDTREEYQDRIKGKTAGLLIGDRALSYRDKANYIYDLGEAWKLHTGLPFVFAAWVSNKKLPDEFIREFNEANGFGLQHIPEIVSTLPDSGFDLLQYYTKRISYKLDDRKREGLDFFLERMGRNGV